MTKIRWGILATGGIAAKFAGDLRLTPDAELTAVGSRRLESAQAFAQRHNVGQAYGSYEQVAADPDVDVVYVATPHAMHYDDVLMCFDAGKSVLCEKALTLNAKDAAELVSTARERGLFFMEAMWMRCNPNIRAMQEVVASGALGDITAVGADLGFVPDEPPDHRLFDPDLGASAVLDIGIYPTTFIWLFMGPPRTVQSTGVLSERGIDLSCAGLFSYDSGAATFHCTMTAPTPTRAFVSGTRGRIDVSPRFHTPSQFSVTVDGHTTSYAHPVAGAGYVDEIEEVHRCLRSGATESSLVPLDDTVAIMRVLDEMRAQIGSTLPGDPGYPARKPRQGTA
jgi:predicted dehydrogenase